MENDAESCNKGQDTRTEAKKEEQQEEHMTMCDLYGGNPCYGQEMREEVFKKANFLSCLLL